MKKYKFNVKGFVAFIILIFLIVSTFSFTNILINNSRRVSEATTSLKVSSKEARNETLEELTKLLNESYFLTKTQRLSLLRTLSTVSLINFDYTNGIKYVVETIYLSQKLGNTRDCAFVLIDLSNVFSDLGAYDIAEEAIKYALSLNIPNEDDKYEINLYAYINLAEIYSKTYRNKEALEAIETAYNVKNPDVEFYIMDMLSLSLTKARASLNEKNIVEAKTILKDVEKGIAEIENNPYFSNVNLAFNIKIPYLSLIAQIQIHEGDILKGIETSNELFDLCDREAGSETKRSYMNAIFKVLNMYSYDYSMSEVKDFENQLLEELNEIIDDKNHLFVAFIIDSCKSKFDVIDSNEYQIKVAIKFMLVILTLSLILIAVSVYARKSKLQTEIDELTQIYNRRKFNLEYKKALKNCTDLGLIIVDIDNFKTLNDEFGHDFGDIVLRKIADKMNNKLSKTEEIFRYGGEEFCILCNSSSLKDVVNIAESLRHEIEQMVLDNNVSVTISLGVAHSKQTNDIFKLADNNLYKSKESGRNKVTYIELP